MPVVRPLSAALLGVVLLAACTGGGGDDGDGGGAQGTPEIVVVGEAQVAEPVAGASQIAMTLANQGDGDDRLVRATTPSALAAEIHVSQVGGGAVSMEIVSGIDLPAGAEVRFQPGRTHLMLVVPDTTVRIGSTLDLTLEFERSETITVPVRVVDLLDMFEESLDADAADAAPAS